MPPGKLKIGYILDDNLDVSDGVQQAVISIAEKMRSRGHEVHYIVSDTKRTDLENIHSIAGYYSMKFNGNSVRTPYPTSKKRVQKLFSEVNFDVLHVQMPYSPLLAAKVINLAPHQVRVFGTFHILPYNRSSEFGTKLLGKVLRRSQKRITKSYAVSKPALEFMTKDFGTKGTVLPNPVDYKFFNSAKPFEGGEKLSIVFVGRFEKRKGVEQLVKAYELLDTDTQKKVILTMCGKGPMHKQLTDYANYKQLSIKFTGFVSEQEKAERLSGADIAIFPSTSGESFGIVLTEAMSAGAGVTLAGNNPGYESVMIDWPKTLFDANKPEEIAKKLTEFIEDKKLRKHYGKMQHEASIHYDIEKIADKLEKDYLN